MKCCERTAATPTMKARSLRRRLSLSFIFLFVYTNRSGNAKGFGTTSGYICLKSKLLQRTKESRAVMRKGGCVMHGACTLFAWGSSSWCCWSGHIRAAVPSPAAAGALLSPPPLASFICSRFRLFFFLFLTGEHFGPIVPVTAAEYVGYACSLSGWERKKQRVVHALFVCVLHYKAVSIHDYNCLACILCSAVPMQIRYSLHLCRFRAT